MVAARAAGPQASMATGGSPSGTISQNASPPIPFMCGYATAMVEAAATIASMALPPSRRMASADCAASECGATAMPRVPRMVFSMLPLYRLERAPATHRLQYEECCERRQQVHRDDQAENREPASRALVQERRERAAEHGAQTLREREEAVVGGRVARAEGGGERRREQREDLSPPEEDNAGQDHEEDRVVARDEPQEHGHSFEAE